MTVHQMYAEPASRRRDPERLHEVIDELIRLYPVVETYVGTWSSAGTGGSSGGMVIPVNLDALTFINGYYWVGSKPADKHTSSPPCWAWTGGRTGPRCGSCSGCREAREVASCVNSGCGCDPDNWRAGLKVTVFSLEALIRRRLGFGEVLRSRATYAGHGTDPWLLDALRYIRTASTVLLDDLPTLAWTVLDELSRLQSRCAGMVEGTGLHFDANWSTCQHCSQLRSVCSDGARAVCVNVDCRHADGSRRCWELDEATASWYEVAEPDGRVGRGRNLADDRVAALRREADDFADVRIGA